MKLFRGNFEGQGDVPDASYILYTWNQSAYVREAVRSALAQRDCRLDIIISDDASTDGTFDVIRDVVQDYSGPHRLRVRQSPRNLGMGHFPSLLRMAQCDIAIHAHGDDVALPDRASTILRAFHNTGASVVSSNAVHIDRAGQQIERLVKDNKIPDPIKVPLQVIQQQRLRCLLC